MVAMPIILLFHEEKNHVKIAKATIFENLILKTWATQLCKFNIMCKNTK